uniref:Serpentine Receptor, class H n=1 Tax=Panagrolaimus sp. PS1159 TaxID=55785 RepID=A0AC35GE63_9BILA
MKHSPKEMKHYKWMLLIQTLWTCNFGLLLGLLWIPVPLFPAMASYIRGPLSILGKSGAHIIMCILSGSALCIASCLLIEIFFRYATVAQLQIYHFITSKKMIPVIAGINLFSFGSGFGVNYMAKVPFSQLRNTTLIVIPDLQPIFDSEIIFGYILDSPYITAYGIYSLVFFGLFSIISNIFIYLLIRSLYKQKTIMSKRNYRMQTSLFIAVAIQFFIPFFFGVVPTVIVTILAHSHIKNITVICEVCLCLGCLHTVFSNLTTVVFVKPYRRAMLKYIGTFVFLITGRKVKWINSGFTSITPRVRGAATTNISNVSRISQFPPPPLTRQLSNVS